jgi:hypothetical protein
VPDIQIKEMFVPIPAELTDPNTNPPVPNSGDNADLMNWAISCAVNSNLCETQLRKIRGLELPGTED